MSGFKWLVLEAHRRSLWQVVAIYIGGAWACYEIIDTITDRLALPGWLPILAIILSLLGLPLVVATAFVHEDATGGPAPSEGARREARGAELRAARQAAIYYRRFITRWADCDPELRGVVTGAEQALARLTEQTETP